MKTMPKTGVVLLAHGSPERVDDIPEFLSLVMNGRPVPPQFIHEVQHRYGLIGQSPLTCWTMEQRDILARELGMPVYVGMRNWRPLIADTVRQMQADGIERVIAICLAPQNSRTSVGLYRRVLTQDNPPFELEFVESWHDHPLLIKAFAEKLLDGWHRACETAGARLPIIFTAHSVPERTIADGDPYQTQAHETAALVAQSCGFNGDDWVFAFQSQGMAGGPWIGPTVEETILQLKQRGHCGVFMDPIGFLCDHVEVLYDIDIAFHQFAEKEHMLLYRAESLNGSPLLTAALVDLVDSRLAALEPVRG